MLRLRQTRLVTATSTLAVGGGAPEGHRPPDASKDGVAAPPPEGPGVVPRMGRDGGYTPAEMRSPLLAGVLAGLLVGLVALAVVVAGLQPETIMPAPPTPPPAPGRKPGRGDLPPQLVPPLPR